MTFVLDPWVRLRASVCVRAPARIQCHSRPDACLCAGGQADKDLVFCGDEALVAPVEDHPQRKQREPALPTLSNVPPCHFGRPHLSRALSHGIVGHGRGLLSKEKPGAFGSFWLVQ